MAEVYDRTDALLYDAYSTGLPGDVGFYVEEATRAGGAVLELGCGTGRILLPVAEAGVDVTGLDLSKSMLSVLRAKLKRAPATVRRRAHPLAGDMRDFDLGRRFRLVTIPFRAFLHNLTVEDQRRTLACCRRHLEPGGRLVFNLFDPRLDMIVAYSGVVSSPVTRYMEFEDPRTGQHVMMLDTRRYQLEEQLVDEYFIFEHLDDDGRVVSKTYQRLTLRWVYRWEMAHLLELCGFRVEALYGSFARGPFHPGREQIWVARPA